MGGGLPEDLVEHGAVGLGELEELPRGQRKIFLSHPRLPSHQARLPSQFRGRGVGSSGSSRVLDDGRHLLDVGQLVLPRFLDKWMIG